MQGQTVKIEAGSLILPEKASRLDDFIADIATFPSSEYSDQVHALSQFLERCTHAENTASISTGCDDPRAIGGSSLRLFGR